MAFEVELKARLRQPEVVKQRVAALGAFIGETLKEDVYYRRRGDPSLAPTDRYRLRREENKAVVTFKQMVTAGEIEVNEEVEFEVNDLHAFFRFANRFDFEPFVVKRKRSQLFQVGRAHVELNEVEHLGYFAEIEILCDHEVDIPDAQAELINLLKSLGLTEADLEPRPYIVMLQEAHPVQYRFTDDPSLAWPFDEVDG